MAGGRDGEETKAESRKDRGPEEDEWEDRILRMMELEDGGCGGGEGARETGRRGGTAKDPEMILIIGGGKMFLLFSITQLQEFLIKRG